MSAQKEKWEIAFSVRQMDSVRKEIPVVFHHGSRSGQGAQFFFSLRTPTQTDGKKPYRNGSPSRLKDRNLHVICGTSRMP